MRCSKGASSVQSLCQLFFFPYPLFHLSPRVVHTLRADNEELSSDHTCAKHQSRSCLTSRTSFLSPPFFHFLALWAFFTLACMHSWPTTKHSKAATPMQRLGPHVGFQDIPPAPPSFSFLNVTCMHCGQQRGALNKLHERTI